MSRLQASVADANAAANNAAQRDGEATSGLGTSPTVPAEYYSATATPPPRTPRPLCRAT